MEESRCSSCTQNSDKQSLKNYRPISLLPIFGKIFERIIYNHIFEIYHLLDNGLEVRGAFLDISKAFDKVWHEGLILKLNQYGISENLLRLIKRFLKNRK